MSMSPRLMTKVPGMGGTSTHVLPRSICSPGLLSVFRMVHMPAKEHNRCCNVCPVHPNHTNSKHKHHVCALGQYNDALAEYTPKSLCAPAPNTPCTCALSNFTGWQPVAFASFCISVSSAQEGNHTE